MQSAIPAQERPARNALTVGVRCVNRTRKHAASVTAYSVLRACPSIQCSTPNLHQQTTGNVESEKGHKKPLKLTGLPFKKYLARRRWIRRYLLRVIVFFEAAVYVVFSRVITRRDDFIAIVPFAFVPNVLTAFQPPAPCPLSFPI